MDSVAKRQRRNMFKLLLFGSAAFFVGKFFTSFIDLFSDKVVSSKDFKNFRFEETNKELTIYGKGDNGVGEEPLLIMEK